MWVQEKMVLKHELLNNIPLHIQEQNFGKDIYELEDHVGEEVLSSNLPPKLGLVRKILFTSFPNFYFCLVAPFKGIK
jgi:hypothetical protein